MEEYLKISEVSDITGIKPRKINDYIEQRIFSPSGKGNKNHKIYSKDDVYELMQIHMYKQLDYTKDQINNLSTVKDKVWYENLNEQIDGLKKKRIKYDNSIIFAEYMRASFLMGEDRTTLSLEEFRNSLENFGIYLRNETLTMDNISNFFKEIQQSLDKNERKSEKENLIEILDMILYMSNYTYDCEETQMLMCELCHLLEEKCDEDLKVEELPFVLLFGLRIFKNRYDVDAFFDTIAGKSGAFDFILNALEYYCKLSKYGKKQYNTIQDGAWREKVKKKIRRNMDKENEIVFTKENTRDAIESVKNENLKLLTEKKELIIQLQKEICDLEDKNEMYEKFLKDTDFDEFAQRLNEEREARIKDGG